jgi:hypothetical protein
MHYCDIVWPRSSSRDCMYTLYLSWCRSHFRALRGHPWSHLGAIEKIPSRANHQTQMSMISVSDVWFLYPNEDDPNQTIGNPIK